LLASRQVITEGLFQRNAYFMRLRSHQGEGITLGEKRKELKKNLKAALGEG
jgi:hypothetical protein